MSDPFQTQITSLEQRDKEQRKKSSQN